MRPSGHLIALILSTLALTFAASPVPHAAADDWLFFRGPNHDGKSAETGWQAVFPESGPKIAWRASVGTGASSLVVKGNRVVTMGNRDNTDVVTCLSAETGEVLWTFEYPCRFESRMFDGGTAATPTIDGDRVYTFSHVGDLHCLKLESGELIWKKQVVEEFGGRPHSRWKYACSPLIHGDLVILDIGGTYSTIALNKLSGAPYWQSGDASAAFATPIVFTDDDRKGIMVFKSASLVACDAENGEQWWTLSWPTRNGVNASSPIVLDGRVFVSSGYGKGGAMFDISGPQPKQLWDNRDITTQFSQCIHLDGHIYGVSDRGNLMCISDQTGDTVWSERGFGKGTLAFASGKLIVLSESGELVIAEASPQGFKASARAEVVQGQRVRCWVNPVLANGRIYCKSNRGDLTCVDVRGSR